MQVVKTLTGQFRKLNKRQRENLQWHLKKKTPIVCGVLGQTVYADGKGGG